MLLNLILKEFYNYVQLEKQNRKRIYKRKNYNKEKEKSKEKDYLLMKD